MRAGNSSIFGANASEESSRLVYKGGTQKRSKLDPLKGSSDGFGRGKLDGRTIKGVLRFHLGPRERGMRARVSKYLSYAKGKKKIPFLPATE